MSETQKSTYKEEKKERVKEKERGIERKRVRVRVRGKRGKSRMRLPDYSAFLEALVRSFMSTNTNA